MRARNVNEVQSFKRGEDPHNKLDIGMDRSWTIGDQLKITENIYMPSAGDEIFRDGEFYSQTEVEKRMWLVFEKNEIATVISLDISDFAEFEGSLGKIILTQDFFEKNPNYWTRI